VYAEAVPVAAVKFAPLPGASKEARARTALGATSTILTSSMRQIVDSARVHGVETTHAAALRWAMDLFLNRFYYSPNTGFNVADYANPVRQAILHNAATAAQQAAEAAALAAKSAQNAAQQAASGKRGREASGGGGGGNGGGGGGGGVRGNEKKPSDSIPPGWSSKALFDLPECLRPANWAKPLGDSECACCGQLHERWNKHGPTSKCTDIPTASGGAGTVWRKSPRFNAFNKDDFSNAYNMPAAGQSAKDANAGKSPPGKDWKPLRSG